MTVALWYGLATCGRLAFYQYLQEPLVLTFYMYALGQHRYLYGINLNKPCCYHNCFDYSHAMTIITITTCNISIFTTTISSTTTRVRAGPFLWPRGSVLNPGCIYYTSLVLLRTTTYHVDATITATTIWWKIKSPNLDSWYAERPYFIKY